MKKALKRHDEILQNTISDSGGWVFKTVGDAFCAAFHTAMDCINCVIEIQIAINSEKWDLPEQIKVRMSIHTGEAIERNNDYYGPALNRVARLEALAYGGQVLISLVTAELVRDMLPEPAGLEFMGNHRLKDLTRPEGVYQLTHPEIPAEFPPIKSLDSHPHNLPVQPDLIIGRKKEIEFLQGEILSSKSRVVSITGTGGMGKTRTSLQTAAEVIERFKNGVFFIDLTLITDASGFYPLILSTFSIKESGSKSEFDLLKEYLKDKNILLILDNFEHVMDAAVHVSRLLAECPGVKVLVTSREAIHIRGELVYRLPPLKIPVFNREKIPSVKKLTQYDSVRMFIDRAMEVNEGFVIDNKNAPAVAEICIRLDGIPLAIELAAARITALSPQALLKRLSHRLEILTFGAADLPDRQQTLRTTIDWSFDLLDKEMQNLFMTLSVFTGGFDIEAAEAVTRTGVEVTVLDGIEHLLEKSLLIKTDQSEGEPWFHMLETIHEYASDQLKSSDLQTIVQEKYAEYFLALAEDGESGIQGRDQKFWMDKLTRNHENLNAALRWFESTSETEKLARMAVGLGYFWQYKGLYSEGISWTEKIVNFEIGNENIEAKINTCLGRLLRESGQYEESKKILGNVLANSSLEDSNYILIKLELAWTLYRMNALEESKKIFNFIFNWVNNQDNEHLKAITKLGIGTIYWRNGDRDNAEHFYVSALEILKGIGDLRSEAMITNNLGMIYLQKKMFKEAEMYFKQALKIFRDIGENNNFKITLNNIAHLNLSNGKPKLALQNYRELLQLLLQNNDYLFSGQTFAGMASANFALGNYETALDLCDKSKGFLINYPESSEYGIVLRILGDIYQVQEKYEKSRSYYEKCIPIFEKNKEKEDLKYSQESLKNLLIIQKLKGEKR